MGRFEEDDRSPPLSSKTSSIASARNQQGNIHDAHVTKIEEAGHPEQQPRPLPSKPLDGGRAAWLSVLGGWCGSFVSLGWMNSVGVFQEYYQQHPLAYYPPSTVAWITSTEIFFLFAGGIVCGQLFDSYGPRHLLLVGTFLHVFGLMMASLGSEYYQFFLAQSVCSAAGTSAIFYSSMDAVSTHFVERRGIALGLIASGSSLGGVVLPIMVTQLLPRLGFGWTMRAVAFLMLGLLIIANVTVTSRLVHKPRRFSFGEVAAPLRDTPFLILAAAFFFFCLGTFVPFNFLILQGEWQGLTPELANYLVPILNAASLFGRIIPAYLADRVGRFNVMILTTGVAGIVALALWLPGRSTATDVAFAALFGFFSGTYASLGPALVAQISDIDEIGLCNGIIFSFVALAALIGSPIGGALLARENGAFSGLQIFCGISMIIGSSCYAWSRSAKVGFNMRVF